MALAAKSMTGLRAQPSLARKAAPVRRAQRVVCRANKEGEEPTMVQRLAVPVATVMTAASLSMAHLAVTPEAALAARSSGRVGSSAGFARRAAPSSNYKMGARTAPTTRATPTHTTTTIVAGAPMFSPFGFGGFGFGGFRVFPAFYTPFPFFGGILSFMFLTLFAGVLFSVVRGLMSASKDGSSSGGGGASGGKKWDDL